MRLFLSLVLFSCFGFSQSNNAQINQALNTAKANNINSKSDVENALRQNGISESQARALARQKGVSYDEILNSNFTDSAVINEDSPKDPNVSDLKTNTDSLLDDISDKNETPKGIFTKEEASNTYFGYNIFENNPYLNKEYLLGNIDEGYLISPGDEMRIITYGDNSLEQNVTVDRNGNINIAGYGLFFASGMTFKTLKSRLKLFLGKYLSGLMSSPARTFLDVSLTQLRPVKVVVLGQVESPGPQILNTSGSALSALYAAGGVKYSGTLREIKIYRNNKLHKTIDLYDYITKGELTKDIRLTNNDIVFVGARKNSIQLSGELYNPAIYETLAGEDLNSLIKIAGGLPPTTQTNKINISRITPSADRTSKVISDRTLLTVALDKNNVSLADGDKITFFQILDIETNVVSISGHVFDPGVYSLKSYSDLKSLIFDAAKGIKPEVYLERVDVVSVNILDGTETFNSYVLSDVIYSNLKIKLKDNDRVTIYSIAQVEGAKLISIGGYGVEDQTIAWKENFSLYDFIFSARIKNQEIQNQLEVQIDSTAVDNTDFLTNLLSSRIDLKRYNIESGDYTSLNYDYNDFEALKAVFLVPKDKVVIYEKSVTEPTNKSVFIYGDVTNDGSYPLDKNMYVEDVILLAGGFKFEADQTVAIINRQKIDPINERLTEKFKISLDKDYLLGLKDTPDNGFILANKDIISLKKQEGYFEAERISVKGEVVFPQSVVLEFRKSSFKSILEACDGLTKYANLEASYLVRNGKVVALDLSKVNNSDKIFEDGDELFIVSNKGEVEVIGAVENPSVFIWDKGTRAKNYIRNSGGKTKNSSKAYVLLPNGKTKKISFFKNPSLLPNSQIIVTEQETKLFENLGDTLQQISSAFTIVASTLTTILLVTRL
jgi:protein involved in polysaccharide export with SLBB domain